MRQKQHVRRPGPCEERVPRLRDTATWVVVIACCCFLIAYLFLHADMLGLIFRWSKAG